MIPALKSEYRKLLTVRSTYFVTLAIVVLSCFFTYVGTSAEFIDAPAPPKDSSQQKVNQQVPVAQVKTKNLHKDKLENNILDATGAAVFISIVVVLLMAHEFRYNTITYTLTAANSRSKVLLAKILVGISYTVFATLVVVSLTVAATYIAVHIKGLNLPPQDINWVYVNSRLLGYILGFAMIGLALITLLRNLTISIVGLFLLPTLDSLLGLLLTKNHIEPARYLPFSALNRVGINGSGGGISSTSMPSIAHAAVVFGLYLAALWAVTWYLFVRRDAN